jgi:hypothetical protein
MARTTKGRRPRAVAARPAGAVEEEEAPHLSSPTAVAAEAKRTGVVPGEVPWREPAIPGAESETIRVGDPDVSPLSNEHSGEESPGGSTPTPDQNVIDEIGRAYGLEEEDAAGPLRPASEILEERDRHRDD